MVKEAAILNCNDRKWSSFLCILGLSSVFYRQTFLHITLIVEHKRLNIYLTAWMVQSRLKVKKGFDDFHFLFCYDGIVQAGEAFKTNYFVSLLFYTHQQKRKPAAVAQLFKKQKLTAILSKKVSKKPDVNISSFFKPTVNPTFHKAPNEAFFLLHHLALTKTLISPMAVSQSINVNQKALLPVPYLP